MYLDFLKKEKHINYNQPLEDIVRKSDVENKIISDIRFSYILNLINNLPQNQKMVVYMCDVCDIEQKEVARIMKISFPALRNLLLRARRKIRKRIDEEM